MADCYKIFTLSPGSTSTKLAVFENDKLIFKANVSHDPEKLKGFAEISDQLSYRKETILEELEKAGISLSEMNAFAAYSGGLESMVGGVYPVNDMILKHSREGRTVKHPAILGAQLIDAFSKEYGAPSFLVNPPDVDEFEDLARVTGMKGIYRESRVHVLNQKEVAMRYAKELGKRYEECNFVVCHVGGGLSVTAHKQGLMVDGNDVLNGDGPMAPNRTGELPAVPLIKMCFSGEFNEKEMIAKVSKTGGLLGHLGTDNTLEITKRIDEGDLYAKLIFDGMAYQLSKYIGSYSVVLEGKVDGIILTGGVSNSCYFTDQITKRCAWIAPVKIYGGDFEMEALAAGALRVLNKEEEPKNYTGDPVWSGFDFVK
ncbi:butyrate kinase [Konateibacter massiliensis]|uniref:butyrate kinase n=1 Tax=Konateibacter massiliensis TaxID=2002841 RepID=UPI000C15FBF2|nr:butyrate kinase [Konateibacter massiliensis]